MGVDEVNVNCTAVGTKAEGYLERNKKAFARDMGGNLWKDLTHEMDEFSNVNFMYWPDWMSANHFDVPHPNRTALTLWRYYPNSEFDYYKQQCQAGTKLVQADFKYYYLDCGGENFMKSGHNWCSYASWKKIYTQNITTAMPSLPDECRGNFMGASAALWTEQVSQQSIITKLFPRLFALAERLWLDPRAGEVKDGSLWIGALGRLRRLSDGNMLSKCYPVEAMQPSLCITHPEYCDSYTKSVQGKPKLPPEPGQEIVE